MTVSMVERVAAGQAAFDGRTLIGMSRGERERYFERARIAIRDLNEPTPAMIAAGWRAVSQAKKAAGIARLGPGPGLVEFYRATTTAALNEQVS